MLIADYTFFDLFWSLLVFFIWVMWFWLLFTIWFDIFRRDDISGGSKTLWLLFTILVPFLGVFVYLIKENDGMMKRAQARSQRDRQHIRRVRAPDGRRVAPAARRRRSRAGRSCSTAV